MNIKFEEEKSLIPPGISLQHSIICYDCGLPFFTHNYIRVKQRKPDCDNYFLCRHCKSLRYQSKKKEKLDLFRSQKDFVKIRREASRKAGAVIHLKRMEAAKSNCLTTIEEVQNANSTYVLFKCSCCGKEQIDPKRSVLKNNMKCVGCVGLDTLIA